MGDDVVIESRKTMGLKMTTKDKLDKNKAPDQYYDGFICQFVYLRERFKPIGKAIFLIPKKEVMHIEITL